MSVLGDTYTKDHIFAVIKEIFAESFELSEDEITLESGLEELDLDSIDAVDLMVEIKRRTGQKLEPAAFKQVRTVGDIVDALFEHLNK